MPDNMKTMILDTVDGRMTITIGGPGNGAISSELRAGGDVVAGSAYDGAIDAIESLVLAHACAGIDVEDPRYLEGVNTALEAIDNHLYEDPEEDENETEDQKSLEEIQEDLEAKMDSGGFSWGADGDSLFAPKGKLFNNGYHDVRFCHIEDDREMYRAMLEMLESEMAGGLLPCEDPDCTRCRKQG